MRIMMALVMAATVVGTAGAGPLKNADVAGDAKWVVHIDMERLRQSDMGRYLLGKLTTEDANNKFAAFMAVFNFDPRKDLSGITAYGASNLPDQAAAIFAGTFDTQRLVTLLKALDTYKQEAYGTWVIHSWVDDSKGTSARQYGCMYPSGRVVIGRGLPAIKKALDVLDGKRASVMPGSALKVQGAGDAMVFAAAVPSEDVMQTDMADFLNLAQYVQFSVQEAGAKLRGELALTAQDASVATNLCAVAQGFIAVAQMTKAQNPDLARLVQGMTVSLDGATVCATMTLTVEQMAGMIEAQIVKAKAATNALPGSATP
jgi:hypothetical protein